MSDAAAAAGTAFRNQGVWQPVPPRAGRGASARPARGAAPARPQHPAAAGAPFLPSAALRPPEPATPCASLKDTSPFQRPAAGDGAGRQLLKLFFNT